MLSRQHIGQDNASKKHKMIFILNYQDQRTTTYLMGTFLVFIYSCLVLIEILKPTSILLVWSRASKIESDGSIKALLKQGGNLLTLGKLW